MNPQPAICPDEGLVYLNTADWTMLLGRKLFGMRNFRLLAELSTEPVCFCPRSCVDDQACINLHHLITVDKSSL
jgi:hypothetical protein